MPEGNTTPESRIVIDGTELPPDLKVAVLDIVVSEYVEGGGSFEITINALDSTNQQLKCLDDDRFTPGAVVEIEVGYLGEFETLIVGEITALRGQFPSDGPALLKVQGFDRLHRLRRGRRTRVYSEMKDSQIAEAIAAELELTPEVEDSEVVHEYVLQNNLSDIDFLLERARRIRYEVIVLDRTLHFRKAANHLGESATLEYMKDLKTFSARLSTAEQTTETRVRGWNPATKEAIIGVARSGDETTQMKGKTIGPEIATTAFGDHVSAITDIPVYSQAEADQIAAARFNDTALELITGEVEAVGNTALRAGLTIEIAGVGARLSGTYYVTRAEHRVSPREGYITKLCVARNAA